MKNIFLTGTIAYGPFKNESDIDVVINPIFARIIEGVLFALGIRISFSVVDDPTYNGSYFKIDNSRKIQIIVPDNDKEFKCWDYATLKMKKQEPISDRFKRIDEFRCLFREAMEK